MSVGKWIMKAICPQKHVHITKDQFFFAWFSSVWSFPNYTLFEIIEQFRLYK